MYVTREIMLLLEKAQKKLEEHDETDLAEDIRDMLFIIKTKKQEKSNYTNIRNKKIRGTYKGDE